MTRVIQVYPLKLPQDPMLRQQLQWFRSLVTQASQALLAQLWSEDWLDTLAASKKKAYKVINEKNVVVRVNNQPIYFPSRVRRGIAERVGRILRSQVGRKACYYDVLQVVMTTGVEGNLDALVKVVARTLIQFHGKYYKRALLRQTLRTFRRYYFQLGLDLQAFTHITYTSLVRPTIHSFVFPYSADNGLDGQAIKLDWSDQSLAVNLNLPKVAQPTQVNDWGWQEFILTIPDKVYQRIQSPSSKLHLPLLRYLTLKSGLQLPFLEITWSNEGGHLPNLIKQRVMVTDLGVINVSTSVICEAGSQLSRPFFWSPANLFLHTIEQLYHHIARIQKKVARYPENWYGQGRRLQERDRLYRKLNRYREVLLHATSNHLLTTALQWQCSTIVLEDLRNYDPPKNQRKLSRQLSNWLRGALFEVLSYKAKRVGITVKRVNPHHTSSYCPRCGASGTKVHEPTHKTPTPTGRFFACQQCSFIADRDYIAAINIYRMYLAHRKQRFSLTFAKPVSYMGSGIPLNRPSGDSTQLMPSG